MRLIAQPAVKDLTPVDAVTASILGWLLALTGWFCDVVDALPCAAWNCPLLREAYAAAKRQIAASLRRTTGELRKIIFLRACAAFRAPTGRIPIRRMARGVRPGLRTTKRARARIWRMATASVIARMHEGSLRERVQRLRTMLKNPTTLVARVLKRLYAIWRAPHGAGLVLVASRETCVSLTALSPRSADTS